MKTNVILIMLAGAGARVASADQDGCCAYGGDGTVTATLTLALGIDVKAQYPGWIGQDPASGRVASFYGGDGDPATAILGMRYDAASGTLFNWNETACTSTSVPGPVQTTFCLGANTTWPVDKGAIAPSSSLSFQLWGQVAAGSATGGVVAVTTDGTCSPVYLLSPSAYDPSHPFGTVSNMVMMFTGGSAARPPDSYFRLPARCNAGKDGG